MPGRTGIFWRHALDVLKRQGPGALARQVLGKLRRLAGRYSPGEYDFGYDRWRALHGAETGPGEVAGEPLVSILLPVYDTDETLLRDAVESIRAQTWGHWELCIVDDASPSSRIRPLLTELQASDPRIRVRHLPDNVGIGAASAAALEMAGGEWIALLDHDDRLAPQALREMLLTASAHPDADLLYSDEDKLAGAKYHSPFFKPDWSPELLDCQNYLGHLLLIRRSLVDAAGGFRPGFDGAQDYDLVLRATRLAREVRHVPRVLYHWRQLPGSTALLFGEKDYAWEAGRRALEGCLKDACPGARAEKGVLPGTYRPVYPVSGEPLVSVILPFRDKPELLDRCLTALFANGGWENLEVVGVNNQSANPATRERMDLWRNRDARIRFVDHDEPFNFAAVCNHGAAEARGDYLLFLNNDVEIQAKGSVEALLRYAARPEIGAVGGRLGYPDGTIQHAGIVVGIGGSAGHPFKGFPADVPGYFCRLQVASNVSAVTAAMLMVARDKFNDAGGFDADRFAIALNDVDFCLTLGNAGYRNVVIPWATGVHFESATRGSDLDAENRQRLAAETTRFREKWATFLEAGDPFYHPALTLESEDYRIAQSDAGV